MSKRKSAVRLEGNARKVLDMYAAGWPLQDIADELHVALTTVKEYLRRIRDTYGMSGRRDLMRLADLAKEETRG